MGMDVYGHNATTNTGKYFRNNVWWWKPLWKYCEQVGKSIIPDDNLGQTNDGWGLNQEQSIKLAALLQEEIDSGRCKDNEIKHNDYCKNAPKEKCTFCEGTGIRTDKVGIDNEMDKRLIFDPKHPRHNQIGVCNGCDSEGFKKPFYTNYHFSVENVQNFVNFLNACGGFEIN